MANVVNARCTAGGCNRMASFGRKGSKVSAKRDYMCVYYTLDTLVLLQFKRSFDRSY
jgi:hypothetical protein